MKRFVLFALLCVFGDYAVAEEKSQVTSLAMNWTHVKNCLIHVLPDYDLKGEVRSVDVLDCETADQDFYKLFTETYSLAVADEMNETTQLAAQSRVYILKSSQMVYFKQLDKKGKYDVLVFCRETCQILNN
jgi:uncharacterized ParB-like nuclease family protein